jgi:iron complex outermembrane receptor protein
MMFDIYKKPASVGVVILTLLACGAVRAADTGEVAASGTGESADNSSGVGLEEIVVSARRRSEDEQKVPISISTLTADDLETRGITNVTALNHSIVNFAPAPTNFFGTDQGGFRIRGLPNVGVYVDGIAYQETFGFFGDLIELDRVEVLRGPQGTLFGKNSLAGAVQYVTKAPDDTFGVRTSATVGDYRRFDASLAADIPLTDTLLSKVTLAKVSRGGYLPSTTVNQEFGSQDDTVARLDVLWKPTSQFNWRAIVERDQLGTNGSATTSLGLSPSCAGIPAAGGNSGPACLYNGIGLKINQGYVFGPQQIYKTGDNYQGPELFTYLTNYSTIVNYTLNDNWALKGLGSYRDVRDRSFDDFASIGYDVFEGSNTNAIDEATGELQLLFSSERFTGTTGLYYYKDYRRYRRENWFTNELKLTVDPANNAAVKAFLGIPPGVVINNFAPSDPDQLTYYKIHGYAGFTEWSWKATDQLTLTAGLRYNRDTSDVVAYTPNQPIPQVCCVPSVSVTSNGAGPLVVNGIAQAVDTVATNTAPRVSVQYQWTPAIMTYATYSEGFNQGGGTQIATGLIPYKPETLRNYEVGARADLFDHTLRVNPSVFYSKYENVQVTEDIDFNDVTVNGGKGRVEGVELEGEWVIGKHVSANYGFGYLDSRYLNSPPGSGILPGTPFPFAPKYSANLGVQYETPLPNAANLTVRADEGWTSGVTTGVDTSSIYIHSYGLLGARLIYEAPSKKWDAQLYGSNLLNKYYILNGYDIVALGLITGTTGQPRMWGLKLNFKFE